METADILYLECRYDFDGELARRVRPEQVGDLRAAALVVRRGYDEIEINEPAAIDCVRRSAGVVAAVRMRDLVTRRRSLVVAYAIGNVDPFTLARPRHPWANLGRRLDEVLARLLWRQLDRVVYGTDTARDLYASRFPPLRARARTTLMPALPARCSCATDPTPEAGHVLFLGDLSERKGIDSVLAAWPVVSAGSPTARLTIVGRGAYREAVEDLAARDPRVEFVHDPPRDQVHRALRTASVVVLPSRRAAGWREQVGLPIIEGLAHGCTVVTTDETGIASWLSEHGHQVLPAAAPSSTLADAVLRAACSPLDPQHVWRSLPSEDSRLNADRWLFAHEPSVG
ncbi:glycosyltransferase family 4 protein [Cellulosimicrobium terreum]|nr:glycosyltransferase family 4 protein [Cellulosimicrobium terreum]